MNSYALIMLVWINGVTYIVPTTFHPSLEECNHRIVRLENDLKNTPVKVKAKCHIIVPEINEDEDEKNK
jgi:hypothetical protein